ncbi:hypothetical protein P170DRAFT_448158 [Aspergillus steynii IBT 23096]|uniref:Class I glutamine amidotransferase-like protein n=1 Tax=Aspergillus steynii IBT 23096 TaxID=1392250 RepID=A0A2I2G6G0_9EURO|nr:uncharacterized protein P170DRAFT_448158 [Aspergillus steynii IBT 23096]PLB48465.1 hypothetical protein P170DRAFT_448158 [Aspergillus steynii IBT 23096]
MTPRPLYIAALDTDVPCPPVYAQRGLYSSQFRVLLRAAAERLQERFSPTGQQSIDVQVTAFDVVGGSFPPFECLRTDSSFSTEQVHHRPTPGPIDAILVTGAAAAAYNDVPWIHALRTYIQKVYTEYPLVKIFGSCFGHQLIAQALLGDETGSICERKAVSVERSEGYEMGVHTISLHPDFQSRFSPLDPFSWERPFRIQLIHGDAVFPTQGRAAERPPTRVCLPEPWINIGSSAACQIQGLYKPGQVLTLQGHFEFDAFATIALCQEFGRRHHWSPEVLASCIEEIERSPEDDSRAAAEVVLLFLAGRDCAMDGGPTKCERTNNLGRNKE